MSVVTSVEVAGAIAEGRAVVALESTIFSTLGLPSPANREALDRCLTAVREHGAVPAVTAVIDGVARVGIDASEHDRVLGGDRKVAVRDLPIAVAQRWSLGATTVSASVALAAAVGVQVFATGGIGGVHRGAEITGDVSADLGALAAYPVVTVCAGAKAFLDLGRTLEHLEMLSVPVLGYQTDELPAFWMRSSGLRVPHRVESAAEAASVASAAWHLGYRGGLLVAAPIPEADALPPDVILAAIDDAEAAAARRGISGAAVTPFVLAHIADATDARSLPANLALAEHNAAIAAEIAVALASSAA